MSLDTQTGQDPCRRIRPRWPQGQREPGLDPLHYAGRSLQAKAKVTEGRQNFGRDGQFHCINATAAEHLAEGQPVISVSVDRTKKGLVGDYANGGKEWEPAGTRDRGERRDPGGGSG